MYSHLWSDGRRTRPFSRAISCITRSTITLERRAYEPSGHGGATRALTLDRFEPVGLQHPSIEIALRVLLHYRVVEDPNEPGSWTVRTAAYYSSLQNLKGKEFLSYHWHPAGRSPVSYPHLHIGSESGIPPRGLITPRTHLPTGHVPIEDFLRLSIEQLGVTPRRPDWSAVLDESRGAFPAS